MGNKWYEQILGPQNAVMTTNEWAAAPATVIRTDDASNRHDDSNRSLEFKIRLMHMPVVPFHSFGNIWNTVDKLHLSKNALRVPVKFINKANCMKRTLDGRREYYHPDDQLLKCKLAMDNQLQRPTRGLFVYSFFGKVNTVGPAVKNCFQLLCMNTCNWSVRFDDMQRDIDFVFVWCKYYSCEIIALVNQLGKPVFWCGFKIKAVNYFY